MIKPEQIPLDVCDAITRARKRGASNAEIMAHALNAWPKQRPCGFLRAHHLRELAELMEGLLTATHGLTLSPALPSPFKEPRI